jgi:hypothetical protein
VSSSEGMWGFLGEGLVVLFVLALIVLFLFVCWWGGVKERWDDLFNL